MWFTILNKLDTPDYLVHKLLWGFFPEQQAFQSERVFCYHDAGDKIYMLSSVEPKTECKKVSLAAGQCVMFSMTASYNRRPSGRDENGKRVYYKQPDITHPQQLKDWLKRRLADTASIQFVDIKKLPPHSIARKDGRKMVWPQHQFMGTLSVHKPGELLEIIGNGIGAGCAFGLGAMILPEVMK